MKTNSILSVLIIACCAILFFSCRRTCGCTPPPFQSTKWKWIKSTGGIGGVTMTPANSGHQITYDFPNNTFSTKIDNTDTTVSVCQFTYDSIPYKNKTGMIFTFYEKYHITSHSGQDSIVIEPRSYEFIRDNDTIKLDPLHIVDGMLEWYLLQ